MKEFLDSIEKSVEAQNWFGALTVVLTLPDIAGKIEFPTLGTSGLRYASWFNLYVGAKYISDEPGYVPVGQTRPQTIWLDGNDCYALRCSFLHEGKSEIVGQPAQQKRGAIDDFIFVLPPKNNNSVHLQVLDQTILQLQIDIFCKDLTDGINDWLEDIAPDNAKKAALEKYLKFYVVRF